MSSGRLRYARLGRHQHLPRAAVLVEVVDVEAAERRRSASKTSAIGTPSVFAFSRSTSTLSCGTVARQSVCAPASCGSLVGAREELLRHLRQPLRAAVAAVLDVELEAAGGAEAEDRRRIEGEHQRLLDAGRSSRTARRRAAAPVTVRSSQCFCVTKIVAALLRKPPPMKSKPVNAMMSWLFGFERIASRHLRRRPCRCARASRRRAGSPR